MISQHERQQSNWINLDQESFFFTFQDFCSFGLEGTKKALIFKLPTNLILKRYLQLVLNYILKRRNVVTGRIIENKNFVQVFNLLS